MLTERLRRHWDAGVMLLILASAFEVPYNLLVGWDDPSIAAWWNWAYIIIFGLDIVVHIVQGDTAARYHDENPPPWSQPERALHYLRSRWFVVDLVAWVPIDLILSHFSGLHAVRVLRLSRSLHLLHAFKGLRAIEALRRQLNRHPAYGRFLLLSFLVPWIIHLHTVLLVWAEKAHAESTIGHYSAAAHHVMVTLLTQDPMPTQSYTGYIIWLSTAALALVVVATVIGNAASLLMGIDSRAADLEQRLSGWHKVFRAYPAIFDEALQGAIIRHEQSRSEEFRRNITGQALLIESLPGELEDQVISRLHETTTAGGNAPVNQLLDLLGGPQS